jgi:hypothetical protein
MTLDRMTFNTIFQITFSTVIKMTLDRMTFSTNN